MWQLPACRLRSAARIAFAKLPFASQSAYVEPWTMLSKGRLKALERSVQSVVRRSIQGNLIECGTAKGGSAALMALCLKRLGSEKRIYVLDTFEGLPAPTRDDPDFDRAKEWTGKCCGSLDEVEFLFRRLGIRKYAIFVKGKFQDTLPQLDVGPFSLVHLDGDWYESTTVCLNHLWDLLTTGGILQIDDYGAWQGCRKAVDEFFQSRMILPELKKIDSTGRWVLKQ